MTPSTGIDGTKMAPGCMMSLAHDATPIPTSLKGTEYHHCCHSNLTRALATVRNLPLEEAEVHVHDVMNVFMCTGYTRDTHQYFMKASPVRPGDFIEFFAEINLLVGLSACPGGDCGASHSDDTAKCYPLNVEVHRPLERVLFGCGGRQPVNALSRGRWTSTLSGWHLAVSSE